MSKSNSAHTRAAKRNARAKAKRVSNAKARNAPSAVISRDRRRKANKLGGFSMEFDRLLDEAVKRINEHPQELLDTEIKNPQDMVAALGKTTSETFKLFSYVALVDSLIESKAIDHQLEVNLAEVGNEMVEIDRRIGATVQLLNVDEEALAVEALDLGTKISSIANQLYQEVERAEPFAFIIEETLAKYAARITDKETQEERNADALQAFAYKFLVKNVIQPKLESDVESETAEETAAAH